MRLSVDQGLRGRISPKLESFGSLLLWLEEKGIYGKDFQKKPLRFITLRWIGGVSRVKWDGTVVLCLMLLY